MNDNLEHRLRRAMVQHDDDITDNPWTDLTSAGSAGGIADEPHRSPSRHARISVDDLSARRGRDRTRLRMPVAAAAAVLILVGGAVTFIGSQRGQDRADAPAASTSVGASSTSDSVDSSEPAPQSTATSGTPYRTAVLMASWPTRYTSITALAHDADLVVAGTFGRVVRTEAILDGGGAPVGTDGTTREFSVQQALKVIGTAPTSIHITQTGSVNEQTRVITEVVDDPLFREGESAVLFLKAGSPGNYSVIGGPTGRFTLTDGLVSAYSSMGAPVKKVPLEMFAAQVDGEGSTPSRSSSTSPAWLTAVATGQATRYGDSSPGTPTWKVMTAASVMASMGFTDSTGSGISITVVQMRGDFVAPRSPQGVERPRGSWLVVAAFNDGRVWTVQLSNRPLF